METRDGDDDEDYISLDVPSLVVQIRQEYDDEGDEGYE